MDADRIPDFEANNYDRSAQVIQIDSSKHVVVIALCSAICGLSLAISLWSGYQAELLQTEYRLVLQHQMQLEAERKEK